MGEANRRRESGDTDDGVLEMSVDHLWPGIDFRTKTHPDTKHPERGDRCLSTLDQIFKEIEDGRGKCTECEATIADKAQMGECSIAHFWNTPEPLSIAIPFCRRCATSPAEVSRLARKAMETFTRLPMHRRQ